MDDKEMDKFAELIKNFNIRVNNEVAYQFIEDISDASNILWDYLINDRSLSFEEKNFIIGFICLDYIENPFITDKPVNLEKAIEKFNQDNIFGVDVLDTYIDKYFSDAILINKYNLLNLGYAEELDIDDDAVVGRIYTVFNNSSFFNDEEKVKILKHLVYNCKCEIDSEKEKYRFSEIDYGYEYLSDLEYYYDHFEDLDVSDNNFIFNLIEHYFKSIIYDDFKVNRLESMISSLLKKTNKLPSIDEIEKLYDEIIYKNEEFCYLDAIEYILEFINPSSFDNYDRFINDKEYGINELIRFYNLSVGNNAKMSEDMEDDVLFINEIARDILYNLIEDVNNINKNTSEIEYYFDIGFGISEYYNLYQKMYNISFNDMLKIQKLCLISDYYNRYSDANTDNDTVSFNISLINNSKRDELLNIFDENFLFRKTVIESFVESTIIDQKNINLCTDINTLYKINPFLMFEMSSNKAYQKKID